MTNKHQALSKYLKKKQIELSNEAGKIVSIVQIARAAGISQPSMNAYFLGDFIPTGKNLYKLADYFGMDIYDILGIDVPLEPGLKTINSYYRQMSPELQQKLEDVARELFEKED